MDRRQASSFLRRLLGGEAVEVFGDWYVLNEKGQICEYFCDAVPAVVGLEGLLVAVYMEGYCEGKEESQKNSLAYLSEDE